MAAPTKVSPGGRGGTSSGSSNGWVTRPGRIWRKNGAVAVPAGSWAEKPLLRAAMQWCQSPSISKHFSTLFNGCSYRRFAAVERPKGLGSSAVFLDLIFLDQNC